MSLYVCYVNEVRNLLKYYVNYFLLEITTFVLLLSVGR